MVQQLYSTPFLALREREGYIYVHMTRGSGCLVAILPYSIRNGETQYLARVEVCPAHKMSPDTYCITGGVGSEETPTEAAKRELLEEAGYEMQASSFEPLGHVYPSKQSDIGVYLYAVDVTDCAQQPILGDGSRWEADASVRWVSYDEGLQIIDPLFITAMARLKG